MPEWSGKQVLQFEIVTDRQQPVNSTRYVTMIDDGAGGLRRFDLYVPDCFFDGLRRPSVLTISIEAGLSGATYSVSTMDDPVLSKLGLEFEEEMRNIYRAATSIGYYPTRFLQMLDERGALGAARHLLHADKVSEGFVKLWEKKRLDLCVEAVVLKSKWSRLFTEEELNIAKTRLQSVGYGS